MSPPLRVDFVPVFSAVTCRAATLPLVCCDTVVPPRGPLVCQRWRFHLCAATPMSPPWVPHMSTVATAQRHRDTHTPHHHTFDDDTHDDATRIGSAILRIHFIFITTANKSEVQQLHYTTAHRWLNSTLWLLTLSMMNYGSLLRYLLYRVCLRRCQDWARGSCHVP